jgi:hypothetical protein
MSLYKIGKGNGGLPVDRTAAWVDTQLAAGHPALVAWMGDPKGEEGRLRQTGTVLLFVEAGMIKCCATDRESGCKVFLAAEGLYGLLLLLEEGLCDGSLDWRLPRPEPIGKSRRG